MGVSWLFFRYSKMSRIATSKRVAKYILLILLCFDSVFSATTKTFLKLEDDEDKDIYGEDKDIYGEDKDILHDDFFRFTTRKRSRWDDWTVPTIDYENYEGSNASPYILFYVFLPIFIFLFIIVFAYICVKNLQSGNCCSFESDSHTSVSADMFTTVHPSLERRRNMASQARRQPTGRNRYSDLFNEFDSNRSPAVNIGVTISLIDSLYASSSNSGTEHVNIVTERPPDYYTVTLSDQVNPTKPAFPLVKKDKEAPPPEYGTD